MIEWQEWLETELRKESDRHSHFEPNPFKFHPSQLSYCKRQAYLAKLSIKKPSDKLLRIFEIGNIYHEYLQELLAKNDPEGRFEMEKPLEITIPSTKDITLVGNCDVFDNALNIVYDFKTRNGWYKFDPPNEGHMTQIQLYQYMLWRKFVEEREDFTESDSIYGQVVYVSKPDMEMRAYPKDTVRAFRPGNEHSELAEKALEKADAIGREIEENGYANSIEQIPYEKCGCWVCKNEQEKQFEFDHLE